MDGWLAQLGVLSGLGLCTAAGVRTTRAAIDWWTGVRRDRRQGIESLREFERQLEVRPEEAPSEATVHGWKGFRRFQVMRTVAESSDVTSFYLQPEDGRRLPTFQPGQYLTLRLNIPGESKPIVRCYSLSDRPRADYYRISVKRAVRSKEKSDAPDGKASGYLHSQVRAGDVLEAQAPRGDFYLRQDDSRPAVLLAAGIGITPLLSMADTLLAASSERHVILLHGVRNKQDHVFREHLRGLSRKHARFHYVPCYSTPSADDQLGVDYAAAQRVDITLLKRILRSPDFPFYVCGPGPFLQSIAAGLHEWGAKSDDVHYEAFGPSTVRRLVVADDATSDKRTTSRIVFQASQVSALWDGRSDSLLELGESNGIPLPSGCRSGNCGMCAVKLLAGKVRYVRKPAAAIEADQCLTCVARPEGSDDVELEA